MSKTRDPAVQERRAGDMAQVETEIHPLKPRRGLFILFAFILIGLLAGVVILYVTTVYPYRDKLHSIETDDAPSAAVRK